MPDETEPTQPEKTEKKNIWAPLMLLLIVLIGGGGFYAYTIFQKKQKEKELSRPDPDADYEDDEDEEIYDIPEEEAYEDEPDRGRGGQ